MTAAAAERLVLHSTWRSLVTGFISPAILVGIGVVSWLVTDRFAVGALVLIGLGSAVMAVAVFDMPRNTVVDADGITRRCLLRHQHLDWDRVSAIVRAPGTLFGGPRNEQARKISRSLGGLTAMVGRRRYLLVDQVESTDEYATLCAVIADHASAVAVRASAPPTDAPPTWTYHQRSKR